jgi:hypothetical protein
MCRSRFDWRDPRSSSRARGWGERVRGSRVPRARGFPVSAAADFGRPRRKRARRSPRATWYSGKPPGVEPDAKIRHRGKERGRARCRTGSSSRARGRAAPTPAELHFLSSMPVFSAGGITGSLVLACVCGGKNVRVRACPSATQPHAWLSQIGGAGPRPVPRDRERRRARDAHGPSGREMHPVGARRDAVAIGQEEHVPPRRGKIRVVRDGDREATKLSSSPADREVDETLFVVT